MAVGPSHRRSGNGAGFSGGHSGERSFGSYRRSSTSGGGSFFPRRPIRINVFGSRVVVSSGRQSLLLVLFMFLLFSIFGCFITSGIKKDCVATISETKSKIEIYKSDAIEYEQANQKATNGYEGYYLLTAFYDVQNTNDNTGFYYDYDNDIKVDGIPYFYLVYEFVEPIDLNGNGILDTYEGETFSAYTSSQAGNWNQKIIVYNDNGSWSSIDEKSYKLDFNMEYQASVDILENVEQTQKSMNTIFVVVLVVTILLVIITILVIVKTIKKGKLEFEKEQKLKDEEIAQAKARSDEAERRAKQVGRHCQYCGSAVPDGDENCSSCGASLFK